MNISYSDKALILSEALPYIKEYYGKIIVIKYGGNALINEELKDCVMQDIVLLKQIGINVVLVHGGGPEINDTLKKMNIPSKFIGGLRQTDGDTMDVVQMVLAGKINKSLVNLVETMGGKAMGICGIDGRMIKAEKKDERLGFVGKITEVDVTPIHNLLDNGYIPIVSTIACDDEGNVYNINADTAAAQIAGELKAERLITMTDIAGILRDKDDPSTLIPEIDTKSAVGLFRDGTISGGMIPKVECCLEAIARGVKKVIIMDGRVPHSLLIETLTNEGAGTMVAEEFSHEHKRN